MTDLALAMLVVLGQLLPGLWLATRVANRLGLEPAAFAALVPLLGLAAVGGTTFVAGHAALIGSWLPWSLSLLGLALVGMDRDAVLGRLNSASQRIRDQWLRAPVSISAVAVGLGMATLASFAPPFRTDEVEYHWAAPMEWAREGSWIESSYRHVDSFPLMEIVYTFAATVESSAAAHLMHLTTLVALGFAAALAAGSVGVRSSGAVGAAAMAMPVVWDQSYVAYNDTAVGAFSVLAAALALTGRWSGGRMGLLCTLLVAAISIKPTAVGAAGVVGLIILMQALQQERTQRNLMGVVRAWVPLTATALLTLSFWTVRRFMITGTWIDSSVSATPTADELSRLPTLTDQLLAPLMPFVLGLLGSSEPWGGRTALVLQVFLVPALAYAIWQRRRIGAAFARVVIPAWTHWLVVGLAIVRTRFHVVTWALLTVGVRLAVEDAADKYPRLRPWLGGVWALAVVLGVADSSFEMLRTIRTIGT